MRDMMRHTEQPKEVTVESIVQEFGFREGEPIPATKVQEMVLKYEKEIMQGLARNQYHFIKYALFGRLIEGPWKQHRASGYNVLLQDPPYKQDMETVHAYFIQMLETTLGTPARTENANEEAKLVFVYEADRTRVFQEESEDRYRTFTGYDAFRVAKIMLGQVPFSTFQGQSSIDTLPDIRTSVAPERHVAYASIHQFLETALRPAETFFEAEVQIDLAWERHHFLKKDALALKRAIWEFGNHDFKNRDGYTLTGTCMGTTLQFNRFVMGRYGIRLSACELTGWKQERASYTREERAELDAEQSASYVHEASIYKKTIIIDWTSRQFDSRKPVPEITDLSADRRLQDRIEIIGE